MIKEIIVFKGILPSKKNSKQIVVRKGRPMIIPSKAYNKWHKEQLKIHKDIFSLSWWWYTFTYYFKIPYNKDWTISKRPFDYSNKIESINDFLVDIWAIEDDNYTIISTQHIYWEMIEWELEVILEITR